MRNADRIAANVAKGCGYISCAALFFIMALVTADVTNRFVSNSSIKGSYEMVQMAMTIMVFFAFPYGQYRKSLIRVDFIVSRFPGKSKYMIWALGDVISTVICYLLAYSAYMQAGVMELSKAKTSILLFKMYKFYYIESAALLVFAIILTYDMVKAVCSVFNDNCEKPF